MHKLIRVLAGMYLAYLTVTVLILLPAANFIVPWYVEKNFGRELHTDIILFDPFSLALKVRGVDLLETDGSSFAGLKRAELNLSLAGVWQPGWVLDAAEIEDLYLHLVRLDAGTFNFSDILAAIPESEPASEDTEALPAITVRHLEFSARDISLTDRAREVPYTTHYRGLAITVNDLSTIIEEGKPYRIVATEESGGTLEWEGTISLPRAHSEGRLALHRFGLVPLWRFAKPWLNLELERGRLDMSGNYDLSWGDTFGYSILDGQLSISDVAITPRDVEALPETAVSLQSITADGIEVDSKTSHVAVSTFRIDSPSVAGWIAGDRLSLAELFAVSGLPGEQAEASSKTDTDGTPWTATLARLQLSGGKLQWRSEFTDPPSLLVSPIDARGENIHWPFEGVSPLALSLRIGDQASVELEGNIELDSGRGNIDYGVEGLNLPWFNPNLPEALHAEISDGVINIRGAVDLAQFLPTRVTLSGSVDHFSGMLREEKESLTSWKAVRLTDLAVDLDAHSVSLEELRIDNYRGRLHIAADGSINTSNLWQEEVGETAADVAQDMELDQPWSVNVPHIIITDSAIDFQDESLPIAFRTVIGDLQGEINHISSDPEARADVNMTGSVDGYAPVALSGVAAPLNQPPALDLTLTFDGVDLSLLTPYSSTYAGYAIERGLLNLKLVYSLEDNRVKGDNDVVINQLKLGERIDSDRAVDLPLELALALLTDMNGVIDLAVPVSGDLDNPEFELGQVIGGAFINLITKAVTAPFTLLANLVGTEEDLQRLTFASGSDELNTASRAKLDQLAEALQQRPGLTLIVSGRLNPEADLQQLQTAALNSELLAGGLSQDQIDDKDDAFASAIEVRYRSLYPDGELPALLSQYRAVRDSLSVSETQLKALAESRAVAVKQYLVMERGMQADRAAIESASLEDEANQFSGVELELDT